LPRVCRPFPGCFVLMAGGPRLLKRAPPNDRIRDCSHHAGRPRTPWREATSIFTSTRVMKGTTACRTC
jgi:hypothetical protein